MIGLPWFLLAIGIFLVLLGFFLAVLSNAPAPKRRRIRSKMRDDEIAKRLHEEEEERLTFQGMVIYAGFACVAVSIAWRLGLPLFF